MNDPRRSFQYWYMYLSSLHATYSVRISFQSQLVRSGSIICSIFVLQVEDAIMQQQVESYKHAIRDWDEQQQRHRVALQQVK